MSYLMAGILLPAPDQRHQRVNGDAPVASLLSAMPSILSSASSHPITWSMLRQHTLSTHSAAVHHMGENTPTCTGIAAGFLSPALQFSVFFSGMSSLFRAHRLSSSLRSNISTFSPLQQADSGHQEYQEHVTFILIRSQQDLPTEIQLGDFTLPLVSITT